MHAGSPDNRPQVRGSHRIRFKVEQANAIAEAHGLEQIQDKAAYFGTTETTYSRVTRGLNDPGEKFIAAVLGSHPDNPDITWDNLFEVVAEVAA